MQSLRELQGIGGIIELTIKLNPLNDFYIPSWPGVFAAKVFYDIISRTGVKVSKREEKDFSLSPIRFDGDGQYPMAGVYPSRTRRHMRWLHVEKGRILILEAYLLSRKLAARIVSELTRNPVINEPCGRLELAGLHGRSINIERVKGAVNGGSWTNLMLEVEYMTPTRFMMRGWCLDYPSPIRFLMSVAKSYYKATGLDVRDIVERLALSHVEFSKSGDRTRQCYVDIGHEGREPRLVKAFYGEASYILHIKKSLLPLIEQLLKTASAMGVGAGRALGFGRTKIRKVDVRS